MGLSTITMARIYKAQKRNLTGYDALLSWELFPYSALIRVNNLVAIFDLPVGLLKRYCSS